MAASRTVLDQEPDSSIARDTSRAPLLRVTAGNLPVGRMLLGVMLVFGACTKLHFNGAWHFRDYYFFFAMVLDSYRTLSLGAVEWLARALPWVELSLGVSLIAGVGTRWASPVTTALLVFMASLPRTAFLGLANSTSPATELLVDTGFFLVALSITLKSFHLQRTKQHQI